MGRVISYGEKTGYNDGDYLLLDNGDGGTKRIRADRVGVKIDPTLTDPNKAAPANAVKPVDSTLTKPGYPADSKVTGDAINKLNDGGLIIKDEIIEEDVEAWLDAHPEATTTVQDGAITEAKLSNTLKPKTIKDYVTPEMFGAVGDGITDDTAAIQEAIDTGNTVVVSGKTYRITTKITNTNGISLVLLKNAVIRLDSAQVIECMFELTNGYSGISYNGKIKGNGIIDGNYKCKTLIGLNLFSSFLIKGVFLQNFTERGIESRYNDESHSASIGGGLTVSKVRIKNINSPELDAYGIYDNGNDNIYQDIIVQDCKHGFFCNNSIFQNCHHWISLLSLFDGSVSFYVNNKTAIISNVIVDTIQTAVEMANSSGVSAVVSGLEMYTNSNVINSETGNQLGFTVFKPNTLAKLRVSDVILMFPSDYTNINFVPDSFFTSGNYITRFGYNNIIYDVVPKNFGDRVFSGNLLNPVTSLDNLSAGVHSTYCNNDTNTGMVGGWAIIIIYPISNTSASIDTQANAIIFNLTNNTMYHAFKRNGTWGKIS